MRQTAVGTRYGIVQMCVACAFTQINMREKTFSDVDKIAQISVSHALTKINMKQTTVGAQHEIVQMPVPYAQQKAYDTIPRARFHEVVQDSTVQTRGRVLPETPINSRS